jgi:hypothetical protein
MNWTNAALLMSVASIMTMSSPSMDSARAGLEEVPEVPAVLPPARDRVLDCGLNLLEAAGRRTDNDYVQGLPGKYRAASLNQEEEFMEYLLSIIYVESRFDGKAVSNMDARGLMQMTEIAVREAAISCPSLRPLGDIAKLHDSHTNVKYGSCFLKKLYEELDGDWTRTLIAYNGGYRALQAYDKGLTVNQESANYVLKVNRALHTICRKNRVDTAP